ncbi:cutinase family protein [Rhodococcus fascians]|nr:cutinase family protein [Rhodococcus fascians]MBY4060440.1 cutinase family protein [Rhodococcus fascians]MBY4069427.1 cutinase family protein [Rhodococcus fascians]
MNASKRMWPALARQRTSRRRSTFIALLALVLTSAMLSTPAVHAQPADPVRSSVLFVIDTSGSMYGTPLAQAKAALSAGIDALAPGQAAGLRSFSGGCGYGGELLVPVATDNKEQLTAAAAQLAANGGTPTPDALRSAANDLPSSGDRTIVLISDGQSSCGDPCATAREIKDGLGVDFRVHTVGFNAPTNAEGELRCIADATGGQYVTATNTEELANAISKAVESTNPADCDDVYFIGVRGSGEEQEKPLEYYESTTTDPVYAKGSGPNANTQGMGEPVKAVFTELHHQAEAGAPEVAGMQARAIRYPAIPVNLLDISYIDRYQRSVKVGADNLTKELRLIATQCQQAKVVIAGYSQGADVINKVMGNAHRSVETSLFAQVKKVVVIGDPSHQPDRPENVGGWDKLGSTNGSGASSSVGIDDRDALKFKDTHSGLVSSICMIGDLVCDSSSLAAHEAIASKFGSQTMTHTLYWALSMQCPAVQNAWQYGTDCSGQLMYNALGHTSIAQNRGGLYPDQIIVQSGTHLWAGFVAVRTRVGGAAKKLTQFIGKLFSDPIDVGSFAVSDDGFAVVDFIVPEVEPGQHHLELRGDDGSAYRLPILVTDEPVADAPPGYVVDGTLVRVEEAPSTGSSGGSGSSSADIFGSLFGS